MVKEELLSHFDIQRAEYIKLLNDKDVLMEWGKPQLEALYSTGVGVYQLQRLQIQLHIKALKRKMGMVCRAIIRNLPVDANAIELIVAKELAEAENNIMQQVMQIKNAKQLLTHLHTPERMGKQLAENRSESFFKD